MMSGHGFRDRYGAAGGEANSSPDGSYELVLDGPGDYSFTVSGEDQARRSHVETVPETSEHRVDLELPSGETDVRSLFEALDLNKDGSIEM